MSVLDRIRVRHRVTGKYGWAGWELALTGPAMLHRHIDWDDGTDSFEHQSQLEVNP